MRLLFLFFIAAGIVACVAGQGCTFTGTDNVDKRLISCSHTNSPIIIGLNAQGIVHLNADAFDNHPNLVLL